MMFIYTLLAFLLSESGYSGLKDEQDDEEKDDVR